MASHRKPKQHPLVGGTARTAATIALAGAATATALEGTGQAAPQQSPDRLKAEVTRYYRQAEVATEQYDGLKEKTDQARTALDRLQDEAARKTERLNQARDALGSYAAAQYRSSGIPSTVRLLFASSPQRFLDQASLVDREGSEQAAAVSRVHQELREVNQVRAGAEAKLAELHREQQALAAHKREIEAKLAAARELLAQLPAADRAAVRDGDTADGSAAPDARASRSAPRIAVRAPSARAAQAVAFAYSALGKPYVWGATGPSSFDCSGLTQAAWQAAGVSLPRTTYTQINAGQRIARSQLEPGDLVFFYSGVSHVGLYVGDGKMIHAPHPGAPVRIAPVDSMPFAGASRPV
ncbi:NlpC/P60 family protein [Streptomyces sp. NPDC052396]|uniref:C40 family peptidase n=1 Tax=Streptomyces sp. NPDC052396 TaxID=3365689 RepID=UPI0037D62AC7